MRELRRHTAGVVAAAPRTSRRLIAALERLDDPRLPIAETNRRLGEIAELIGLPRPSYEQVRRIVRAQRAGYRPPGVGSILLDISFRGAPPEALLDVVAGTAPPSPRTK